MTVTAAKWIDSWARLQFRFFLNLFSCLLTTNLSRRNNRSRAGPQTLFNFRRNSNRRWIPITFHVYSRLLLVHSSCCHQKCSLDRDRMQITLVSFYDHDSTQSECAHRLVTWRSPRWRRRSPKLLKRLLDQRINGSKANIQVTWPKKFHLRSNIWLHSEVYELHNVGIILGIFRIGVFNGPSGTPFL